MQALPEPKTPMHMIAISISVLLINCVALFGHASNDLVKVLLLFSTYINIGLLYYHLRAKDFFWVAARIARKEFEEKPKSMRDVNLALFSMCCLVWPKMLYIKAHKKGRKEKEMVILILEALEIAGKEGSESPKLTEYAIKIRALE